MLKKNQPPPLARILRFMALWFFCFSLPAYANSGLDWLINQAQPDGHYSTPDDLATPFQATAETWRTLTQMGETPTTQPTMTAALDFINAETFPSTEHLARILITRTLAGQTVNELITDLTARLQLGGGLGDLPNYDRTVIDTALALEALAMTDFVNTSIEALYPAIDFLLQQQNNGGWADNDNETSIDVTAIVMRALWYYRHHVSHIPSLDVESALEQAQTYLLTQLAQGDSETFATALALIAIIPRLPHLDGISAHLDSLRTTQLANGSWDNDVYTTALALRGIKMAETPIPNPDLGQIIGTIIDGQTGLALSGIDVQLTGTATESQLTNSSGQFDFNGLDAGNYTIQITDHSGTGLTTETQINQGQIIQLGEIRLFRGTNATTLQGTVTDANTGEPLAGATILVTGITETIVTDEQGAYLISHLEPGEVMLQASHNGYLTASTSLTMTAGATLMFSLALSPDVAAIEGIITDGNTNLPLAEADIFINGQSTTQTQMDGSYRIENLSSGEVHILVEQEGYDPMISTVSLPTHTIVTFSPQLYPTGSNPTIEDKAGVMGTVLDRATGLPLSGVTVTHGPQTVTTNENGQFNFTHLAAGEVLLQLTLANYRTETLNFILSPFTQLDLGEIALIPNGYQIPVGVKGIVRDASNNQALADVNILVQFGETTQTLASNINGQFNISGSVEGNLSGQLSFAIEGYISYTLDIFLVEDEILNIGQVRLRPEEVTVLLPDLRVKVDNIGIHTDLQTLTISGNVVAEVNNIGTAPLSSNIALLSFYDTDLNGVYDTDVDISLGEAVIENALAVEESTTVTISLTGQLPFRDAPIKVWVDSLQAIVESDEENNVGSTSKMCEVEPNITFKEKLKWEWIGSTVYPEHNQVTSAQVVAPLEDTNGDGNINQLDMPSVIFHTYKSGQSYESILRVVSGKYGHELWKEKIQKDKSSYTIEGLSNIAVADIDNDGFVEIVAAKYYLKRTFIAYEHTGEVKWQETMPLGTTFHRFSGALSIADLNGDDSPEIIAGNTILNANGSLFWQGDGYYGSNRSGASPIAVVADINLDGKLEIILGASAYSFSVDNDDVIGKRLWQNENVGDGFVAIGNFNDDIYPEIVVISAKKSVLFSSAYVHLLDHDGNKIWGEGVIIPGEPYAGPPTIGDMDGDGIPEIGVASKTMYAVFKADGSELWKSPIQDGTSATGSSVFDFDGDGQMEVVYADEQYLRIYRGRDGMVLLEIPNTNGTFQELPVIADVDNDNHADIIVGANNYGPSSNYGIRVYQEKNNRWANTRKIWNQHSYHITNINDDGTVPAVEPNSWEVHNTYRAQPVLPGTTTGIPDLTAGHLLIIDNGVGQPVTLQVRIGNAGLAPSAANLPLTFYADAPANNGTKLGTVMLDVFEPGTYQDIQLTNVELPDLNQTIYAVVDAQNTLSECNEGNNSISLPISGGETTLAQLGLNVTTDAPDYGPNTPVTINYSVTNQGALPTDFQVEVRLEDANGETLEILQAPSLETLASGETLSNNLAWNTSTTLVGPYQVQVLLLSANGELVTETTQEFTINAGDEGQVLTLRATTDKLTYHSTDVVQIQALLQNQSLNVLIEDALLRVTVNGPDQQVLHTESQAFQALPPNGIQEILLPYMLQAAALGTYTVDVEILAHDGTTLATQTGTFQVAEQRHLSLVGQVETELAQLTRGQVQHCTETITNTGTQAVTSLAVQHLLINVETQATLITQTATVDLAPGTSQTQTLSYYTLSLPIAHYACVLQAQLEGQWETLDFQTFNLHQILSSECNTVYAIHDQKRDDTRLFTYDLNDNLITTLGPLYPQRDLEGMDIHPYTHHLYASAGHKNAHLYQVDGYNGDLTPIGAIGFDDVVALSFHPTGELWGWAKKGLIRLNLDTAQGDLVLASQLPIEGLAWNNAGTLLYGVSLSTSKIDSTLYVYDPQQQTLTPRCEHLLGEVESLEILPDDRLAFGIHNDKQLSFQVYDVAQCQTVNHAQILTPFNDIEAIAWPTANCTAQQLALRAFLIALSDTNDLFLGEDGNLRIPMNGQIYQGQLAESTTQGTIPVNGELQLVATPDANEDGIDDFLITYPDGQQKILYYLGTTTEE